MNTPSPNAIPGQTPITDPLQLQFLTGGQMGYMPQAQFMTPSEFGAFRTMPTPDVNGFIPQQQSIFQAYLTAHRGSILGLPAYTFNTYNPAVSFSLQQVYAQRRMSDTASMIPAMVGNGLMSVASMAGLGFVPGLAASMIMPDLTKPVTDRIAETRNIQNMSTARIFSGPDRDAALGMGFSYKAARSLDKSIRLAAADDSILKEGDYRQLLKLGIEYGQFDYANNVEQYKRILKNLRGTLTTMMEVVGSTDFKDLMKDMKRMQDMGATIKEYGTIARREQSYARMLGLTQQQAVETYGKSGAVIFQQAGLNAMQGSLQSMANAANMTYLQRTGVLDPVEVAKHGGISGLSQRMTQFDATVQNSIKDYILPALMNDTMTGLRKDVDFGAILKDPNGLQKLMAGAGRIQTPEQMLAYKANSHKAFTELTGMYGPDIIEVLVAKKIGEMAGIKGPAAAVAGLQITGMDYEMAWLKTQGVFSKEAQGARERTMEEARQKQREEMEQRNSPVRRLERFFKGMFAETGEAVYRANRYFAKQNEARAIDAAGRVQPITVPQSDFERRHSPVRTSGLNTDAVSSLLTKSDLSDNEALDLLAEMSPAVMSETGKTGLDAMRVVKAGGYGALQMTPYHFAKFFGEGGKGHKYASILGLSEEEIGLLTSMQLKQDGKKKGPFTEEEKAVLKKLGSKWQDAVQEEGFIGAYATHLRDEAYTNIRSAELKHGQIGVFRENASLMTTMLGVANHFGIEPFEKVIRESFGSLSEADIRAEIERDGGLSLVRSLYRNADIEFNRIQEQRAKENGKPYTRNNRYRVGGREYTAAVANIKRKRHADTADGKTIAAIARQVGRTAEFSSEYAQQTRRKKDGSGFYRPDCSGVVYEIINRYVKKNGGVVFKDAELNARYGSNRESDIVTSGTIYKDIVASGGGDNTYSAWGEDWDPVTRQLKEQLTPGTIIAVDYDPGARKDNYRDIEHMGIVLDNGKILHQSQSNDGATEVSIDEFIDIYKNIGKKGGATFHTTSLTEAAKWRRNTQPGMRGPSELDIERRLTAMFGDATKEADRLLKEDITPGYFSKIGNAVFGGEATFEDVQKLIMTKTIGKRLNEGDVRADPTPLMAGGINAILKEIFGSEATVRLSDADIQGIAYKHLDKSKNLLDVLGKWDANTNLETQPIHVRDAMLEMLYKSNPELFKDESKRKEALTLANRAIRKTLAADKRSGFESVFHGARTLYMSKVLANPDHKLLKDLNELSQEVTPELNKFIRKNLNNKLQYRFGFINRDRNYEEALDLYKDIITDATPLAGSEFGVGQRFESIGYLAQLASEQMAVLKNGDNIDSDTKERLRKQFHTWGESVNLSKEKIDSILSSEGKSTYDIMRKMYEAMGITIDERKSSLITKWAEAYGLEKYKKDNLGVYTSGESGGGGTPEGMDDWAIRNRLDSRARDTNFGKHGSDTDIRKAANHIRLVEAELAAKAYGFSLRDINKMTKSEQDLAINIFSQYGLEDMASALEESQQTGAPIPVSKLPGLLPSPVSKGSENPMSNPIIADEFAMEQVKLAQLIHSGGGGGSGLLSPQTDQALQDLPGALDKLNTTLENINGVLSGRIRESAPRAQGEL